MWETSADVEARASAAAVWELWEDATRWRDWNDQIASAELHGPLAVGTKARIRFKRSMPLVFTITALEHGRLLTDEARLPGARLGHEHRVDTTSRGAARIRNRLYLDGPAERLWALLLGRQMQASVRRFVQREPELAEASR
jgi:hypothetical protein